jgi:Xaa-Pro aminopeptidase
VGCDALLVTHLVNIRYLTGFTGSAAMLLVLPDRLVLTTDGRYRDQSRDQLAAAGVDADIEVGATLAAQQAALSAAAAGIARLGLEAEAVTWAEQRRFAAEWFRHAELVATEGLVEAQRRVKDDGEVARMAEAASIADDALANVRPLLGDGLTEKEIALALDYEMRRLGAEGSSFETIVASGPNGAKPHARPSERAIGAGELVVIDFGAVVEGYCSDMTRTLCVGEPASDVARRMVEVVAGSQRAVGLEIHEAPRVASTSEDTLATGHVVTVEPGVYLPDVGGVRIEDTVVVTEDGCLPLTNAPKELVV